jgi:hypothetical protein
MVPGADPRSVCTPIDPDKAESLLRSFNIYNKWSHVITGLREGFDVGIKSLPTETILFREPRLISSQPRFHIFVHGERTCKWSLLPTIYPVGAGSLNRAISHFTHWARPKTQLSKIQVNTRPILPPQPSNYPGCQCWRMLRRLSHSLGHLRDNYNLDSFSTPRLSSSDIRHISSVPTGPHSSRPAECLLPILGRESEGRSSSNVWLIIECWGLWVRCRHACRYLYLSRVWPIDQMGRRFLCHKLTRKLLDRIRIYQPNSSNWHPVEFGKVTFPLILPAIHRLRLESSNENSQPSSGKGLSYSILTPPLGISRHKGQSARGSKSTWQIGSYLMHLSSNPTLPSFIIPLLSQFQVIPSTSPPTRPCYCGSSLDHHLARDPSQRASSDALRPNRSRLVGGRQHLLWNRRHHQELLGYMAMGTQRNNWPKTTIRHRVGRSCGSRISPLPCPFGRFPFTQALPRTFRQFRGRCCPEQWPLSQPGDKYHSKEHLYHTGTARNTLISNIYPEPRERGGCIIQRKHSSLSERFSASEHSFHHGPPGPPLPAPRTIPITIMSFFGTSITPQHPFQQSPDLNEDTPALHPNYGLRPKCKAEDRIFLWKGVNTPPPSVIDDPVIHMLANLASHESLRDTSGPGSAIKKFHTFCDIFSIPESHRLPASFEVLHSFAIWVVTDPSTLDTSLISNTHFEPVSIATARKYLAGIRAWHFAQSWPEPLSKEAHNG